MSDANPNSQRRYRRRIVGWGLLILVLGFVIPSVFAVRWAHSDLENRVTNELVANGIDGVTVEFSGQDGTFECEDPLDDYDAVISLAVDVYGVNAIDLDRSCLPGRVTGSDDESATSEPEPTTSTDITASTVPVESLPAVSDPPTTEAATSTTEVVEPELESLVDVARADPQFSQLASLLETAGLVETLAADGPFTMLAPTDDAFDAAFEAVGADAFEALTSDPERLRAVLLHHVVDGAIRSTDFTTGPLTMLDGTDVDVTPGDNGVTFTSGDIETETTDPAQLDIEAANGVMHAVDQVLLPAVDPVVEPTVVVATATTSATLDGGQLTLAGTIASEEQRTVLLDSALAQLAAGNVFDELVLDPEAAVTDADIGRLAVAVGVLPVNLVSGSASLNGEQLAIDGVHTGDEANTALEALAAEVEADLDVEARDLADEAAAQELQDELNEFVQLNPILFESNSAELTPEADEVVEQVAARAQRFSGVNITLIGHTDSDGDPQRNQVLSEGRALTVLNELIARGLDATSLAAEGRGVTEPILDAAGVEDKNASRRVEFIVQAQS